ncbi:alpha/beta hydrolase [Lentzea nigeriaca]|nr:hypothetical protein [Lentzea nigeriaca]
MPVLVVGNHFDGSTNLRGAQAVARQLPNTHLLGAANA